MEKGGWRKEDGERSKWIMLALVLILFVIVIVTCFSPPMQTKSKFRQNYRMNRIGMNFS
jgi:flagellar basal body-associated protein FliL